MKLLGNFLKLYNVLSESVLLIKGTEKESNS